MRGWWCTYSVLSLGTVGQPYLRERTNKDRGKLLGIELYFLPNRSFPGHSGTWTVRRNQMDDLN